MNKRLLKSKMAAYGDTGGTLSAYLGICQNTFSMKINEKNGAMFTQGEIMKIKERYNLNADEVDAIFFS